MIGFIITLTISVVLIVLYIMIEVRLTKKYGMPELPDDVKWLDDRIENELIRFDLTTFTFKKEQFGRRIYGRSYATRDGTWHQTVEIGDGIAVAYRAVLKHNRSWLLGCTREKCNKTIQPKIILIGE